MMDPVTHHTPQADAIAEQRQAEAEALAGPLREFVQILAEQIDQPSYRTGYRAGRQDGYSEGYEQGVRDARYHVSIGDPEWFADRPAGRP